MRITEKQITAENIFEQMALMTKKKLVENGVLPSDADKIAIAFVKERGEQVVKNVVKNEKQ